MSKQKESLIIVGARGMGRELAGYLMTEGYSVKGFLDGGLSETKWTYPIPILDSPENWMPSHDERFIVALGEAKWRRYYVNLLAGRGAQFTSFISKHAFVGPRVSIGEGAIIVPTVVLTGDIRLGRHCILNVHTSVSHDCIVDDFVTFSPGSRIPGRCVLAKDVFLGVNASLIPDVTLAAKIVVGAGAVVTKSYETEGITLVGVPAKRLR